MQVGPGDIPNPCPHCRQMTLHRPGPDGRLYCLPCMMRPMQAAPAFAPQVQQPARQPAPVLIEQTSKQWKGGIFLGGLGAIVGMIAIGSGATAAGGVIFVLGSLLYVVSRLGAWWHHG